MKQTRQFGFPLWIAAAAIGLAACGERMESGQAPEGMQSPSRAAQNERPMDSTRDPGAAPMMPGGAQADAALGEAVKSQLARDPQLGTAPIQVEVAGDGKVALKGSAPTAAARERAAQLAMAVRGVTKVDNQLTVVGS
jgi:hyperosmotically inducible protein